MLTENQKDKLITCLQSLYENECDKTDTLIRIINQIRKELKLAIIAKDKYSDNFEEIKILEELVSFIDNLNIELKK